MQSERGPQHGTSRRTPLPLFRAVSIFCLSVAILDLATCGIRPQPAALREGYQTGRGPPTSGASGYRSGGCHLTATPEAAKRPRLRRNVMAIQPLVLIDPLPRTLDAICDAETRRRLEALGRLVVSENRPMPDEEVERLLPEVDILIGQTPMPRARLDRASKLKAIFNVETNFLPNIDYQRCQERGIWVLSPTSAFAVVVAESALSMAIDLARGISAADRAFRAGEEKYGLAGNP